MKRTAVALLFGFFAATAAYPQNASAGNATAACQLTVQQSPAIRGLKLGMSTDQVLSLFPGSGEDPYVLTTLAAAKRAPRYGLAYLTFSSKSYNTGQQFAGVNKIEIYLFDDRVFSFRVHYSGQSDPEPWDNADQFIEKLAQTYKLPAARSWSETNSGRRKELLCAGFVMTASVETGCCPSLNLGTPDPRQEIEERRRAEQKKARDAFIP